MENGKFYTRDSNDNICECKVIDAPRVIIESGFIVDEDDIEEGALYYFDNNKVHCCSWFNLGKPFKIMSGENMDKYYFTCNNNGDVGYYGTSKAQAESDLEFNKIAYPNDEWEMFEECE